MEVYPMLLDICYLAVGVAFFAVAVGMLRGCAKL